MSAEKSTSNGGRFFQNDAVSVAESEVSVSPLNPRLEIQLRKERQVLEEDANYTYKPTLINKPRKGSDKDNENRFDRLYSDALKRHLESKWKESVEDKDLTFKPKISAKGSNSRAASRERGSSSESIANRLYSPKPKTVEAEEFSFKPSITKRAKSIDRSQHRETPERLYLHSKVAKEKQEKLKQDFDQKALEDCTFAPKTNPTRTTSSKDLTERMEKYEEYKARRLEEAIRVKNETDLMGVTFKPTIKVTKRFATPTKGSVYERLTSSVDRSSDNASVHAEQQAHLTFKPQLVSKRAPSPSPRKSNGTEYKDVHERLFREGQQRQKELEVERQLLQEENEAHLTFTPVINPKGSGVARHKDALSPADKEKESGPVFERLSATSNRQHMQEVLAKIKTDLEMRDCTFKPRFSTEHRPPVQKETSADPIYVRLAQEGERIKADQQRKAEIKANEEISGLTFSPSIPVRSSSIARRRSSVMASVDGTPEDNIYTRLANTPKASSLVSEHDSNTPVQTKVLAKQDLEKVFRRLSVATTESLAASARDATLSETAEQPEIVSPMRRSSIITSSSNGDATTPTSGVKKSVQLPEKVVEQIFTNLSLKRTASWSQRMVAQEEESNGPPAKSPIRTVKLPENNLDKIFERLSTTGTLSSSSTDPADDPPQRTLKSAGNSTNTSAVKVSPMVTTQKSILKSSQSERQQYADVTQESLPSAPPITTAAVNQQPKVTALPPAPPAVPSKSKSKTAAPAAAGGGGDFLSKLEASLNFLENQQKTGGAPVLQQQQKQQEVVTAPPAAVTTNGYSSHDSAEVVAAPAPRPASKIPVSPKNNTTKPPVSSSSAKQSSSGSSSNHSNKNPPKRLPSQDLSESAPPAAKVIKGKKKSDSAGSSVATSANTSQIIPVDSVPATATATAIQSNKAPSFDDATRFLDSIPNVATDGSDSDSAPEEH